MRQAVSHTPQRRSFATDTSKEFLSEGIRRLAVGMPIQPSRGPEREHGLPTSLPSRIRRCHVAEYSAGKMQHLVSPRKTGNHSRCSNPCTAFPEPESLRTDAGFGRKGQMLPAQNHRLSDDVENTIQSILD